MRVFGIFGKSKAADMGSKAIYEPEDLSSPDLKYSNWRKPADPNSTAYYHKKKYIVLERRVNSIFDGINLVLSLLIVVCFIYLIFLTDFDEAVLTDGTQLSCVVHSDGTLEPYKPPKIETKILSREIKPKSQNTTQQR